MPEPTETKRVNISLPAESYKLLEAMAQTGAYGSQPTDVAKTLVLDGIRAALRDRLITPPAASNP